MALYNRPVNSTKVAYFNTQVTTKKNGIIAFLVSYTSVITLKLGASFTNLVAMAKYNKNEC